jgi:hypothetical protein
MSSIRTCALPHGALLGRYLGGGGYTDCYVTDVPGRVSHAEYVEAFYTSAVFKLERLILAWLASLPSTDAQARGLAAGTLNSFAAWRVEERNTEELLLRPLGGRTRSWLMCTATENGTRLYFGSAVVPVVDAKSGKAGLGRVYRLLLGFHKLYSRVLLRAAAGKLRAP